MALRCISGPKKKQAGDIEKDIMRNIIRIMRVIERWG
jgi:hypothetical protein